jgi:hypothetical protein
MMPKSVKRFSDDITLYLFDLKTDSDFRSIRPEPSGSRPARRMMVRGKAVQSRHGILPTEIG